MIESLVEELERTKLFVVGNHKVPYVEKLEIIEPFIPILNMVYLL